MSPKCGDERGGKGMQDMRPPGGRLVGDGFLDLDLSFGVLGGEIGFLKYGDFAGGFFSWTCFVGEGSASGTDFRECVSTTETGIGVAFGFDGVTFLAVLATDATALWAGLWSGISTMVGATAAGFDGVFVNLPLVFRGC